MVSPRGLTSDDKATVILNEAAVQGKNTVLTPSQQAIFMHVGDTAAIALGVSVCAAHEVSTSLMEQSADVLVSKGFRVDDRRPAEDRQRIVGYEIEESPARRRAPVVKSACK